MCTKKRADLFSRFDRTQLVTNRRTDRHRATANTALAQRRAGKKPLNFEEPFGILSVNGEEGNL